MTHKRYSVAFGRIGGDHGLVYLGTRADAQQLGEVLQRLWCDTAPSEFCRIKRACSRWRTELPDGRYVEVSDTQRMTRVYEFGRWWNKLTPRGHIKWLLNRVHVTTTRDEDIADDIRNRAAANPGFTPELVDEAIEYALLCHRRNQDFYSSVMRGSAR